MAEQRERWLGQQDEGLTWHLRAEAAEIQHQELRDLTNLITTLLTHVIHTFWTKLLAQLSIAA